MATLKDFLSTRKAEIKALQAALRKELAEIQAVTDLPVWVSEVGVSTFGAEEVQEFGLKRTAESLGVRVYEDTKATDLKRDGIGVMVSRVTTGDTSANAGLPDTSRSRRPSPARSICSARNRAGRSPRRR